MKRQVDTEDNKESSKKAKVDLFELIEQNNIEAAQEAINSNPTLVEQLKDGVNILDFAIEKGHQQLVFWLLSKDTYMAENNSSGIEHKNNNSNQVYNAYFDRALKDGQLELINTLIKEKKININFVDKDFKDGYGLTALHTATQKGYVDVIKTLLATGADANAKDFIGVTPLDYATLAGDKELIETLLANGAGSTPLHYAALAGDKALVQTMLANGADVNTQDYFGDTPIEKAFSRGDKGLVKTLLANGAILKVDLAYKLFNLAVSKGDNLLVHSLTNRIDINSVKDAKGLTPLHHAAKADSKDAINILLENGADIEALCSPNMSEFVIPYLLVCDNYPTSTNKLILKYNPDSPITFPQDELNKCKIISMQVQRICKSEALDKTIKINELNQEDILYAQDCMKFSFKQIKISDLRAFELYLNQCGGNEDIVKFFKNNVDILKLEIEIIEGALREHLTSDTSLAVPYSGVCTNMFKFMDADNEIVKKQITNTLDFYKNNPQFKEPGKLLEHCVTNFDGKQNFLTRVANNDLNNPKDNQRPILEEKTGIFYMPKPNIVELINSILVGDFINESNIVNSLNTLLGQITEGSDITNFYAYHFSE